MHAAVIRNGNGNGIGIQSRKWNTPKPPYNESVSNHSRAVMIVSRESFFLYGKLTNFPCNDFVRVFRKFG